MEPWSLEYSQKQFEKDYPLSEMDIKSNDFLNINFTSGML